MKFLSKIKITPLILFLILLVILVVAIIFGSNKEGFEDETTDETEERNNDKKKEKADCNNDNKKEKAHCDGGKIYIHADSEILSESKKNDKDCFEACKSNPECEMYLMNDEGTCYNYKNVKDVSMYCSPGEEPKSHTLWGDIKKRIYDKIIKFPVLEQKKEEKETEEENQDYILKTQIVPPVCPTCPTCPQMPEKVSCTNCGGNGGSGTKGPDGGSLVGDEKQYKKQSGESNPLSETVKVTGGLVDKTITTGDSLVRDTASGATGIAKDTVTGATGIAKDTVTGATGIAKDTASGATSLLRDFGSGVKDVLTMDRRQSNNGSKQMLPQQGVPSGSSANPLVLGTNNQYSGASPMRQSVAETKAKYLPITADFSAFGR